MEQKLCCEAFGQFMGPAVGGLRSETGAGVSLRLHLASCLRTGQGRHGRLFPHPFSFSSAGPLMFVPCETSIY